MNLKKLMALALAVLMTLCVLACTPEENEDPKATEKPADVEATEGAEPTVDPDAEKYGGTLMVPAGDPRTLLFWLQKSTGSALGDSLNDVLLAVDPDDPYNDEKLTYRVCESYEKSEDNLTYTFHLRDNVYWHDGEKLTAEDVVFSHDVWQDTDWFYPVNWKLDGTWTALDELTVEVVLTEPDTTYLQLVSRYLSLIPKHCFEGLSYDQWMTSDYAFHPIGCGPFKFVEYVVGDYIRVEANEDFWNGRPYLDEVIYKVVGGSSEQEIAFETSQLSLIKPTASYYNEIKDDGYKFIIEENGTTNERLEFTMATFQASFLQDAKARQAFAYAIDYESINNKIYYGCSSQSLSPFAKGVAGYEEVLDYHYDIDKANQLFDEAGYADTDGNGWRNSPTGLIPWDPDASGGDLAVQLWYFEAGGAQEYCAIIIAEGLQKCGVLAVPYLVNTGSFLETMLGDSEQSDTVEKMKELLMTGEMVMLLNMDYGAFPGEYRYLCDPTLSQGVANVTDEDWAAMYQELLGDKNGEIDYALFWMMQGATQGAIDNWVELEALYRKLHASQTSEEYQNVTRDIQATYGEGCWAIPYATPWLMYAYQPNVHYEDCKIDLRLNTFGWCMEKMWVE